MCFTLPVGMVRTTPQSVGLQHLATQRQTKEHGQVYKRAVLTYITATTMPLDFWTQVSLHTYR